MPILLKPRKRQIYFVGEVIDERLFNILSYDHPLILHVVKSIMGLVFIMGDHKYMVNTDITAMFLATTLYIGIPKARTKKLSQIIFTSAFFWWGD